MLRNALHIGVDPQIDVLLRRVLTPESWRVQDAPSNGSAIELVKAQSYDLIVTSEKASGEEDIEFWHDLDTGYAGRERL